MLIQCLITVTISTFEKLLVNQCSIDDDFIMLKWIHIVSIAPFTRAFGCSLCRPIPRLRLNLSEAARGDILLRPGSASGGGIRAVLLENRTSVNSVAAGFCSYQSRAHSLTNQLSADCDQMIEWVRSGVLLLGWRENLQPHQHFVEQFGHACFKATVLLCSVHVDFWSYFWRTFVKFVSPGVSGQIDNSPPKPGRKPYKMKRCVLKKVQKSNCFWIFNK